MSMTRSQWLQEVARRVAINEGCELRVYRDSMGTKTIGIGFNCERGDAVPALTKIGVKDINAVLGGQQALTPAEVQALFEYSFAPVEAQARASLAPGIFDSMTDARRFVVCDLVFNLGNTGWLQFEGTRSLLNKAQHAKNNGDVPMSHPLFVAAADHLTASAWFSQVGYRAMRNVAMIRDGGWVNANGDGE